MELPKAYNAREVEDEIYKRWESSGFFNPDNLDGEPYTIIMPPPNATGTLHIGHAFEAAIQDTMIRYKRMQGRKTLWLPGTDHAAIATNTKVEKDLIKKEDKNRHDIGREAFVKRVEEFIATSRGVIQNQLRRMGASVDWSREAFTMDEPRQKAVQTAFRELYDAGLIYMGERIVNWDVKGQTTVSDDEVVNKLEQGELYTFKYSKDFPIAVATSRPETKVGDVAVAVNPSDARYRKYIGKEYDVEFAGVNLKIKIVGDEAVDPEFGTGAVGVTPAHSMTDFEIAQRHSLPSIQVINEYGKMTDNAGALVAGKKTKEARVLILKWLTDNNLLEKTETVEQSIPTAERTGGVIEPLPKKNQWFIAVNKEFEKNGKTTTLKKLMREAVESGQIKIWPEHFEKIYFHWIDNLRDWNISRQLFYGHPIPKIEGMPESEDTLDTWFSSALWTFSTLGWPEKTKDLETFHPTDLMAPGYEILFFWVARMILMSTFLLGEVPFKQVVLHGIVRDKKGQKFSKSLDNGIDPLDMSDRYGTDALRFALVFGAAPGNDVKFDEQKVKGMQHFANKLWNIARFILTNVGPSVIPDLIRNRDLPGKLTDADREILSQLKTTIESVNKNLENFQLHEAAQIIYQFIWHEFADVYIEASKQQLKNQDTKNQTEQILVHCLTTALKLLHPFMPFVTEHIWSQLEPDSLLMIQKYPR